MNGSLLITLPPTIRGCNVSAMNEALKKEAREELINDIKAVEPRLWDKEYQRAIEGAINSFIDRATLAERKRCAEIARETHKVCAYCHDTGVMKVAKMRGGGYENRRDCVWCKDGKEKGKLEDDQLVANYKYASNEDIAKTIESDVLPRPAHPDEGTIATAIEKGDQV